MCRVISFVSAKGGVGKTTIIFHVANELSKNYRVCVFDSYFCVNDISRRFCCDESTDLKNYLIGTMGTENVLKKFNNNLYVVGTNEIFNYLNHGELIKFFISEIAFKFDYILIDVNSFDFRVLDLMLSVSGEVVLVCDDDEICVRNTSRLMGFIRNLCELKNLKFILNKARIIHSMKNRCLNINDISDLLEIKPIFIIPKFYKNNHKKREIKFEKAKVYIKNLSYSIITNKMYEYDVCKRYKGLLGIIRRIRCFKYE